MDDSTQRGSQEAQSRRALVTGASAGIGKAFADRLARDGYDLAVVARDSERLDDLARRWSGDHGVSVEVLPADLTVAPDVGRVEEYVEGLPALDLLVNNAGFGTNGRFAELALAGEIAEIQLNVIAAVRLTRAALPGMIERQTGAIVNVSSMAAFQPTPYNATYSCTKAFVTAFTEAIHEELRGTGVNVQSLCPGFTRTEFHERSRVDVSNIPEVAWMSAEAVVESSLAALSQGKVVHIPGFGNRAMAAVVTSLPRSWVRWLLGRAMERGAAASIARAHRM